ncbi:MAG: LCP family protein [Defluviitaleaceae bacterium]|nr:LCP family protein [Defluviitaleaceae bacterium]
MLKRLINSRRLLVKTMVITSISALVVVGVGFSAWRALVQPPSVPTLSEQPFFNPNYRDTHDTAFDFAEPHPDDALINAPDDLPFSLASSGDWTRKEDFFTFLVFGYDDGLNTDTIMVAAYDAVTRQAYIVSIPRDTRVDVRRNIRRINSAYPVGLRHSGEGHAGGVDQLKRELQTLIGFRPDFYVSVEEEAFVRLIDAVGGVYINVPFHMRYDDPCQDLRINIPAGHQLLNGENALHFVRFRLGNDPRHTISDMQRMKHQQELINAVMQQMMSPRMIAQVPELIRTYRDHVSTDLTMLQLLWFAEQASLGAGITLHTYNYPTTSTRIAITPEVFRWYEIPDATDALELINRTINPFTTDITTANLQLAN